MSGNWFKVTGVTREETWNKKPCIETLRANYTRWREEERNQRSNDILGLTDSRWEIFVPGSGAHTSSLQQRQQGFALSGPVLTPQSGAAASRVHPARLAFTQCARQTAAAARLAHPLGAVTWQRLALAERTVVTRFTAHHRPRSRHRAGKSRKQRRQPERTRSRHRAKPDRAK